MEPAPKHNFSQVVLPGVKVLLEAILCFFQFRQKSLHGVISLAFVVENHAVFGIRISVARPFQQKLMNPRCYYVFPN